MAQTVNTSVQCGGCWGAIFYVETGIATIITEDGFNILTESGDNILPENSMADQKISEFTPYTAGQVLPIGSYIPVIVPVGGGEFDNFRYNIGGKSLATYIDVVTNGTDSITDPRITQDVMIVLYDTQSLVYDFSLAGDTITSQTFADLGGGRTIRIVFGNEIPE